MLLPYWFFDYAFVTQQWKRKICVETENKTCVKLIRNAGINYLERNLKNDGIVRIVLTNLSGSGPLKSYVLEKN